MISPGVEQLLILLDQAFDGDQEHSLMANLKNVSAEDWHARPANGGRSIRQIVYHAGVAKHVYADHLFGDASTTFERVLREAPATRDASEMDVVMPWLREGHRLMRDGAAGLGDADLTTPSRSHWGEVRETRLLIYAMIEHDVYHAGEINHLRAQRQGDDTWPWQ